MGAAPRHPQRGRLQRGRRLRDSPTRIVEILAPTAPADLRYRQAKSAQTCKRTNLYVGFCVYVFPSCHRVRTVLSGPPRPTRQTPEPAFPPVAIPPAPDRPPVGTGGFVAWRTSPPPCLGGAAPRTGAVPSTLSWPVGGLFRPPIPRLLLSRLNRQPLIEHRCDRRDQWSRVLGVVGGLPSRSSNAARNPRRTAGLDHLPVGHR